MQGAVLATFARGAGRRRAAALSRRDEGVIEYFSYGRLLVVRLLGSMGLPIPRRCAIVAAGMLSHQQMMRWWLALPTASWASSHGDMISTGRAALGRRVLDQR